jgi:hypothetical protein
MSRWRVIDWASNMMNWGEFESFEDAWGAIMNHCGDDEEAMGEYYAVEADTPVRERRYLDPCDPRAGTSCTIGCGP